MLAMDEDLSLYREAKTPQIERTFDATEALRNAKVESTKWSVKLWIKKC
jgi:hypothetical protein